MSPFDPASKEDRSRVLLKAWCDADRPPEIVAIRDYIDALEEKSDRCGGENCMGYRLRDSANWVREERLGDAERTNALLVTAGRESEVRCRDAESRFQHLQVKIAEAEKDTERLDWLAQHLGDVDLECVTLPRVIHWVRSEPIRYERETLREAIDAAREGDG